MSGLEAFRAQVRGFLDEKLTPDLRAAAARQAGVFAEGRLVREWHKILYEAGWIAPSWPKAYGGTGWTPMERYIFELECAEADAPSLPVMGLQMCGPVIMHFGTEGQKDFFLPRILSGEHYWCQGYSEPQSGSDLASLQCRAERDGDDYVVNGTKIWTTHAHFANWIFLLVRTSREAKPQAGISFIVTPLSAPGISVRPIISISGDHEINQVFFDNVRIPVANRIGPENEGWTVAKYLLEFERGAGAQSARLRRLLHRARGIAEAEGVWSAEAGLRSRFAELDIAISAHEQAERGVARTLAAGGEIGNSIASRLKLSASEIQQGVTEMALEALGAWGFADQTMARAEGANVAPVGPDYALTPVAKYLNTRAATIYGGSSEIQRNILARVALGL